MNTCAARFIETLKVKELNFGVHEPNDETIVTFPYHGRTTLIVFSGSNGDHVQLITVVEAVPAEHYEEAVLACNKLNCIYRYVKFFVDKDNDIVTYVDAIVNEETAGEECFKLLVYNCQTLDEAPRHLIPKGLPF